MGWKVVGVVRAEITKAKVAQFHSVHELSDDVPFCRFSEKKLPAHNHMKQYIFSNITIIRKQSTSPGKIDLKIFV